MIAAIVLAAGSARRFGSDKRRQPIAGVPMLTRTLTTYRRVLSLVVAVIRPDESDIAELAASAGCQVAVAPDADRGQSRSLAAGVTSLASLAGAASDPTPIDGVLIGLGDMPFVHPETLQRLVDAMIENPDSIVRPRSHGQGGNPVGFPKRLIDHLARLEGDQGARQLVAGSPDVVYVDVNDRGVLDDVDRPENLDRRKSR